MFAEKASRCMAAVVCICSQYASRLGKTLWVHAAQDMRIYVPAHSYEVEP